MTIDTPTLVVVNPVSAGGQTMRRWPQIRTALREAGIDIHAHLTTGRGDATLVTRREITGRACVRRVVAVGGHAPSHHQLGRTDAPRDDPFGS